MVYSEKPSASGATSAAAGQRASLILGYQSNLLRAHQDCVRAVACLDAPFRGGILTGDRSGVIKVWRVEGLSDTASTSYG